LAVVGARAAHAGDGALDAASDRVHEARADMGPLIDESLEGIDRIRGIVANLKNFARPDHEQSVAMVNLNDCCRQSLAVAHHEISQRAEVRLEFGHLPEIECRPSEINQVLLNLLINAAHAMPVRGTITVRSGADDLVCWVEVEDTGEGIPVEVQSRVFDPFFTTKPVGSGTGLGLSIAYGIAKSHGGQLTFVSRPGAGTLFRLELPLKPAQPISA
jgi:signal transduction histidine kinase